MLVDLRVPKAWRNPLVDFYKRQTIKLPLHPDFIAISKLQPTLSKFIFQNMIKVKA
jgi:hypothetical protein